MSGKWSRFLWSGILIVAFMAPGLAIAADEKGQLPEEVMVTAQKKEQNLKDVPSSVVSVSGEKLDVLTAGGQDIRLLSSRIPSLHIESSYGRTLPRFYIRGLGNTDFDLNASQPVSLVYDEVVLENPILKGFPIFDLDRVEVLRGPQGTLFGRNTPAGIVKFESRKPSHEAGGFGRVSYGAYSSIQAEGAYGGSLVEDQLAFRLSGLYQGRGDWVDNTFSGETDALGGYADIAGRVQLLFTPDDKFSALLNYHMRDLDGTARLFRANLVESGSNEIRDGFDRGEISVDGGNEQTVKESGGVAKLEYDFGTTTLTSVTGYESGEIYSRGDVDGGFGAVYTPTMGPGTIPFQSETADEIPSLTQVTQELRLSSNDWETFNWQTGFFYFKEDLEINTINFDTGTGAENGFASQEQNTKAWAFFGNGEWRMADHFIASAGARYSEDEKDFWAERTLTPFGGANLARKSVNVKDNFWSYDAKGLVIVNDDVNLYSRVAKGFRAPSIQGRVLFGDDITVANTEQILSFEYGIKADLSRQARVNFNVFHYTMDNQQLTAVGGGANFNRLLNADQTEGKGFELDVEYMPDPQLLFTFGASYNHTEIDDALLKTQVPGAAGVTILDPLDPANATLVLIDGNSLPNAPDWVFNMTARASTPMGDSGELYLYTDWAYRSEISFFLYESTEFMEDALIEGGARVGYVSYTGGYEVSAFARNILDDVSRTGAIDFNNLTGFVNEPRIWGLEFRRNF